MAGVASSEWEGVVAVAVVASEDEDEEEEEEEQDGKIKTSVDNSVKP